MIALLDRKDQLNLLACNKVLELALESTPWINVTSEEVVVVPQIFAPGQWN